MNYSPLAALYVACVFVYIYGNKKNTKTHATYKAAHGHINVVHMRIFRTGWNLYATVQDFFKILKVFIQNVSVFIVRQVGFIDQFNIKVNIILIFLRRSIQYNNYNISVL